MSSNTTLVTGLWDLGRSNLDKDWSRNFSTYLDNLSKLLDSTKDTNIIVFSSESIKDHILSKRDTRIYWIKHEEEDFCSDFFPFCEQVEKIRNNEGWLNQVGWLSGSTQAMLQMYNPVVMSKMFFLHNASIMNVFDSDFFYWIDAGINNTVHPGYFSHDNVIDKLETIIDSFMFIRYPYKTDTEIHGFDIKEMNRICGKEVDHVCRGGFFGGHKESISKMNGQYYHLLNDTLNNGYMGTEESIFSLIANLNKDVQLFDINGDGLVFKFFEDIKNYKKPVIINSNVPSTVKLYINTYNSPKQLKSVINSFEEKDLDFLNKTNKVLINNSTKSEYDSEYNEICNTYGFEQIKQGNLGICGGRQFAAEHFGDSDDKYMMFFEDDMLLDFTGYCGFGFRKEVKNLLKTIVKIMDKENYDFLKMSFSEFYGDNSEQWSWHNVPEDKRQLYFGDIKSRPTTEFKCIKRINKIPYAEGEIYYCNWPHIISRQGNQKMFLDTKWAHPYEQTWMSHIYTLTKEKVINSALLLASPITHNRTEHYDKEERREN
tara:strand:- start:4043 stop:5671 length:1629 start_codon:yes stop_codon:yes gene_type:complete